MSKGTMNPARLVWVRIGDLYPDLKDQPDSFIALDGEDAETEVGFVMLVEMGPDEGRWMWSMLLTAFRRPTNGLCATRAEAEHQLVENWRAFRDWFRLA